MARTIGQTLLLLALIFGIAIPAQASDRTQLLMAASSCFGFESAAPGTFPSAEPAPLQCDLLGHTIPVGPPNDPFIDSTARETCPFESCAVSGYRDTGDEFTLSCSQAIPSKESMIDLARAVPARELARMIAPSAVPYFEGVYQSFTWDGSSAGEWVDCERMYTSAPAATSAREISLSHSALATSISNSWDRLSQGLPNVQPVAPLPSQDRHAIAPQVMDSYWQYYADCDRWKVVFANAAAPSACDDMSWLDAHVQVPTAPSGWSMVRSLADYVWVQDVASHIRTWKTLMQESALRLSQAVAEVYAEIEFRAIESSVHHLDTEFFLPILSNMTAEIKTALASETWENRGQDVFNQVSGWSAVRSANALAEQITRRQTELERIQLSRYLAPRLNWLGGRLTRLSDQLENRSRNARYSKPSSTWK